MKKIGKSKPRKLSGDEAIIAEAKERYKRGRKSQEKENTEFRDDVRFAFDPDSQWPEAIRKQREIDMRPCITVNRMPQFINQVVNDYRQNTPAISVRPVDDGADVDTAEVFTGLVRHIERNSGAEMAKENALLYAVSGGKGFYRVLTDYVPNSFNQDIQIKPILNSLTVTYDCDDTSLDGSGWRWCFIEEEYSKERFEAEFPDEDITSWVSAEDDYGWTRDDGDRIRVAEYYYKECKNITLYLMPDGNVVSSEDTDGEPDGYVDKREALSDVVKWCKIGGNAKKLLDKKEWAGRFIPVIPVWGDVVLVDGKVCRLSLIRNAKDAQRMVNFWRSTEAELLALQSKAPFIGLAEQFEGYEQDWIAANSSNMPFLKYNNVAGAPAPMRQGFASPPTGVLAAAQNAATDMMDIMGIHEAGLGQRSNETSGRAIMARQAEGDNATFHFIDNAARSDRYCGMILIDLIPKIYDTERVVRVLGVDGSEQMKTVNAPFIEKGEYGQEIERIYDLDVGTYDVVVSSGPSYNTKRQEAADAMMGIVQANPQLMGVIGDLLVKAMDWPGADEMAERLKKMLPPNIAPAEDEENPMPPEVAAQIEQMQMAGQQMQEMIMQLQAQLEDKQGDMMVKARELEIKQMDAETRRMAVMKEGQPSASISVDADSELSEADKIEIEIEKVMALKQMEFDQQRQLKILDAKIAKLKDSDDLDIDEEGNEVPSELMQAVALLAQNQAELMQKLNESQIAIEQMAAASTAPRKLIRDENGRPVGVEIVTNGG